MCMCGVYSGRKLSSSSLSACGSDLLPSQAHLSWSTKSTPLLPRGWANEPCDFWVQRWSNYFYILGKLLVKVFARTQLCEDDLDIVRHEPGQYDHFPRKVGDAYWRSHVQHENVPAITQDRALQDERYSLRNGHEIARNLRVSDRDGSTGGDLSRERGHDTAGTAEHVTEAHGHKLCSGVPSRGYLPINFTQPLCRASHTADPLYAAVSGCVCSFFALVWLALILPLFSYFRPSKVLWF